MSRIKNFFQWFASGVARNTPAYTGQPTQRPLVDLHEEIALLATRIHNGAVWFEDEDQTLRLMMGASSLANEIARRFGVKYEGLDDDSLSEAFRKIWKDRP